MAQNDDVRDVGVWLICDYIAHALPIDHNSVIYYLIEKNMFQYVRNVYNY